MLQQDRSTPDRLSRTLAATCCGMDLGQAATKSAHLHHKQQHVRRAGIAGAAADRFALYCIEPRFIPRERWHALPPLRDERREQRRAPSESVHHLQAPGA